MEFDDIFMVQITFEKFQMKNLKKKGPKPAVSIRRNNLSGSFIWSQVYNSELCPTETASISLEFTNLR